MRDETWLWWRFVAQLVRHSPQVAAHLREQGELMLDELMPATLCMSAEAEETEDEETEDEEVEGGPPCRS